MSYVDFDYYKNTFKGSLTEETFNTLVQKACDVTEMYIMSLIPFDKVKALEEYEFDLKKCVCYQIDCFNEIGDVSTDGGKTDSDIRTVNIDGFSYTYGKSKFESINGVPISPMNPLYIKKNLNKYKYMSKLVNA